MRRDALLSARWFQQAVHLVAEEHGQVFPGIPPTCIQATFLFQLANITLFLLIWRWNQG